MAKFHINPETGKVSLCRAKVQECPLGGEHFDTIEEAADTVYEVLSERDPEIKKLSTLSKKTKDKMDKLESKTSELQKDLNWRTYGEPTRSTWKREASAQDFHSGFRKLRNKIFGTFDKHPFAENFHKAWVGIGGFTVAAATVVVAAKAGLLDPADPGMMLIAGAGLSSAVAGGLAGVWYSELHNNILQERILSRRKTWRKAHDKLQKIQNELKDRAYENPAKELTEAEKGVKFAFQESLNRR